MPGVPCIFRIVLQVSDLERAAAFHSSLLGSAGRRIRGSRHYFDCGPVILTILDPTPGGAAPVAVAETYFAVSDLEAMHRRAEQLGCLSTEEVHGASGADIVTRPWGERSFYAVDPFGNGLCFVDVTTVFTGA